ncbi:type IX secretion system membrane protein PorP/SprF [Marinilabilia salmonicolor]|jgi:type IX secretion system PorP/SprF family membrane protein|uniref:Type IX secretion system PorP/SprF family membrane protein n=1 Tax=Marinilabilia salmonicolor TaxID=989 RepID=A0A2T0WXI1_9BACT|nr:type IX secretion system membrane protein PorP/SprF [Marinilabilia salmonicolor]PRY91413.1 type IX secretion system PorP/SprF family membrane protein [Marinilabilia salmonicolor]RCW37497.1 type IX secretion system PorP/SprF family membrane protein [Marinilabilia salmonicolor]
MDLAFCVDNIRSFDGDKGLSSKQIGVLRGGGKKTVSPIFNKIKSRSFVFFLLFCISSGLYAQFDPMFSQNMFNHLNTNPGYAGNSGKMNVVLMNRNQWTGLEGAPVTTVAGADAALNLFGKKVGVGLEVMNDDIGFFNNLMIRLSFARRYLLGEGELGIGISTGILSQSFDGSGIEIPESDYHDPNDPMVPSEKISGFAPDFGLGAFYQGPGWYAGAGVQHLFSPEPNFQDDFYVYVHRSLFLTGGYLINLEERNFDLEPSIFFRQGGGSWQADLNLNLHFREKYWAGLTYRYQDAVVLLAGLNLKNGIRAGYSYDITTSKLSNTGSSGSHEIMIGYSFDLNINKKQKRYKSVRFL